jgi:phosphoribosylanthranilate isomerase
MFIKICGITNLDDALCAAEYEASAIGFNFYRESKRYVSPETAAMIIRELPDTVRRIGVFVNADPEFVKKTAAQLLLDFVQFHGDETPEYVRLFGAQAIKAFRLWDGFDPAMLQEYGTSLTLLDAWDPDVFGGTGKTIDWSMARRAGAYGKIILAGGLTPENVADAIRAADPFGVDAASGVESSPGHKDHAKLKEFITIARNTKVEPSAGAGL